MEDEDLDPVGDPLANPRAAFYAAAVSAGLIREGDPLDQNLVDYARSIVELCASIGDQYTVHDGGNAGEHIRAELLK
jgi:hypothetical protein